MRLTFSLTSCCWSLESSDRSIPFEVEGPASDSGELGVRFGLRVGTGSGDSAGVTCSGDELVVVPGGERADPLTGSSDLLSRLAADFRILCETASVRSEKRRHQRDK